MYGELIWADLDTHSNPQTNANSSPVAVLVPIYTQGFRRRVIIRKAFLSWLACQERTALAAAAAAQLRVRRLRRAMAAWRLYRGHSLALAESHRRAELYHSRRLRILTLAAWRDQARRQQLLSRTLVAAAGRRCGRTLLGVLSTWRSWGERRSVKASQLVLAQASHRRRVLSRGLRSWQNWLEQALAKAYWDERLSEARSCLSKSCGGRILAAWGALAVRSKARSEMVEGRFRAGSLRRAMGRWRLAAAAASERREVFFTRQRSNALKRAWIAWSAGCRIVAGRNARAAYWQAFNRRRTLGIAFRGWLVASKAGPASREAAGQLVTAHRLRETSSRYLTCFLTYKKLNHGRKSGLLTLYLCLFFLEWFPIAQLGS